MGCFELPVMRKNNREGLLLIIAVSPHRALIQLELASQAVVTVHGHVAIGQRGASNTGLLGINLSEHGGFSSHEIKLTHRLACLRGFLRGLTQALAAHFCGR